MSKSTRVQASALFAKRGRPYYVFTPRYTSKSCGIKVMHLLCHALNRMGEEAYVVTDRVNPDLRTPILTPEIYDSHKGAAIAIYPEVVSGNPLNAGVVVRYILNTPGLLGGDTSYDKSELLYAYSSNLLMQDMTESQILTFPCTDTTIFNNDDNPLDHQRKGSCYYIGKFKYAGVDAKEVPADSIEITPEYPESPEKVAELFRRMEVFYCYDNSALAIEACLCGCPTVFIPNKFLKKVILEKELGWDGMAWGLAEEEIRRAHATVGRFPNNYLRLEARMWERLVSLVQLTQTVEPQSIGENKKIDWNSLMSNRKFEAIERYGEWHSWRKLQPGDAQVMAERSVLKWKSRPIIHLVTIVMSDQQVLLADLIDSIGVQLYQEWKLTVVADFSCPDPLLVGMEMIEWVEVGADSIHILHINKAVENTPSDWVILLNPGTRLEPSFLFSIADYHNARPDWKFIYSDEDAINLRGELIDPQFKPDFNLELLRSMPYLGSVCAVRRASLIEAGGYTVLPGFEHQDIAFRIFERYGAKSIGHIDDVLYHIPAALLHKVLANSNSSADVSVKEQIGLMCVNQHLARMGVKATVDVAIEPMTYKLSYQYDRLPMVSIIVPARDNFSLLRGCISSLLEKTRYPNFELLIVDNDSSSVDVHDYYAELIGESRVRILRYLHEFNFAAVCNHAATEAVGEYLLFLNHDTQVVQESWLDNMMSFCQRSDVGVVGAKLVFPETGKISHAGVILGMGGVAGHAFTDDAMGFSNPGYMNRARVNQELSAVSGLCMLTRREVFEAVDGMDQEGLHVGYADVDYCLRVGRLGYRIIWTPDSVLVHHGGSIHLASVTDRVRVAKDLERSEADAENMYSRWLPKLSADPNYNRHLTLYGGGYSVENSVVATWDNNFHDHPRILGVPLSGGSGEYRIISPLRRLRHLGRAQTAITSTRKYFHTRVLTVPELARLDLDSLVVHAAIDDKQMHALGNYKKFVPETFRVFSLDDRLTDIPVKSSFYKTAFKDAKSRLKKALSLCDRAVVSTEPLRELCAEFIDDVRVIPNCIEAAVWSSLTMEKRRGPKPRIGWAGAQQHAGDLEILVEVVKQTYQYVDWVFMGMCIDEIRPYIAEFTDFVLSYYDYPKVLAGLGIDIAVAPLEVNLFNEAKSNLRILEYGMLSCPVICTDIYPYHDAPVTRVPNNTSAWVDAIMGLAADLDRAEAEGAMLNQWVRSNYLLENRMDDWFSGLVR